MRKEGRIQDRTVIDDPLIDIVLFAIKNDRSPMAHVLQPSSFFGQFDR